MLLTVVVPCHDEEAVLDDLVAGVTDVLDRSGVAFELVLVDDGSRDRTLAMMRELRAADPRVHYVSFSRNFGKEAAMLAGLAYARGDAVVIMDADLQHPPDLLPAMLERHRAGYDQVVARRTREGDPAGRRLVSRGYYRLVNALVDVPMVDGEGDFRLLSRRAVDVLLAMGESNRFSKGLFSWVGFPSTTIAYRNRARKGGGTSRWSLRRLLNYGIDGILSFNDRPLRVAIFLGTLVTLLAFAYGAFVAVAALVGGVSVPGYVTLVAGVTGLGGIQLLFLGVLGEYVGRIYFEAKRRPHFVVSEDDAVPGAGPMPPADGGPARPPRSAAAVRWLGPGPASRADP